MAYRKFCRTALAVCLKTTLLNAGWRNARLVVLFLCAVAELHAQPAVKTMTELQIEKRVAALCSR